MRTIMNKLILLILLGISQFSMAQVWSEDFGEADGSVTGTAMGTPGGSWSVTTTPSNTFSVQNVTAVGKSFFVDNTVSEGVWQSNAMVIPSPGFATISVDLVTAGTNSSDYIRVYYKVDGGPEVLFAELMGQLVNATSTGSAYVSGTTLQIVMRGRDNQFGTFFGVPLGFTMDNLTITLVPAVFSRKNSTWTDVTSGNSTWSATALGGTSCNCTPAATQVAVIGGGFTVTLPSSQNVGAVSVKSTGVLQYNTNNTTLTVLEGLFRVENGGVVNSSGPGITGEQIAFNGDVPGAALQVDVGGNVSIEDVVLSANASNLHYFTGGGTLTITDDVLIAADDATLTNDMTSPLTVTDRIEFSAGTQDSRFVNNNPLTAAAVFYDDDSNIFTNNNTVTLSGIVVNAADDDNNSFVNNSTLNLNGAVSINTNSADFFIDNFGTINQAGDFSGLVNGSDFTNETGGTWNWSFSTGTLAANFAGAMVCSPTNNTFNYNAAGNQVIGGITYYNLNNLVSGTKTLGGNASVTGTMSIAGTAVMNPSTFNLSVTGLTSITGGSFNDNSDTGTDTFIGNVSVGGSTSFVSTSVTTTGNLIFRGGIDNSGTFTAGGATFNTNNQSVTGANNLSFANNVAITGATLTNSNTGSFTVTGTTTLTNGGFADNDNTNVTTFVGAVTQSGTSSFNTTTVTTPANLIFRNGITNNGGTFTAGAATFDTNNQAIAGNTAISFANTVTVPAITVTNNNTASVSFTRVPGEITLTGSGTWTQGNNSTLNYSGTSIGITTFNASNTGNTVNYNSTTSSQTIRTPSSTYTNLSLNNTSGSSPHFTIGANLTVTGILTMTSGNTDLSGNSISLTSTASGALVHGLTAASGWMYGGSITRTRPGSTLITVGTAHSLFPLGSSGNWRPFFAAQTSHANSAGTITVSHTNSTVTSNVVFPESITRRHEAYWSVSSTGISAGPTFNLRAGGTSFGTIEAGAPGLADLRMCTDAGVVGTHGAATGGPDYRVNRTAVAFASLANNYHVASTDNVNSPLPVELINFKAQVVADGVQLSWATASESNNDFFTIERSASGEEFSSIGIINGKGTTNQRSSYLLTDPHPLNGRSYYRLKQTDFDGTFTYSSIISVTYDGPTAAGLRVYPNPFNGIEINIEVTGLEEVKNIPAVLYDELGRERAKFMVEAGSHAERSVQRVVFSEPLPKGVYILKVGQLPSLTTRLVITN